MSHSEPPRATPVQYTARLGTRWEKEKAAAGQGAFDFPDDPHMVGPWIIGECVGKGASGRVRVARHSQTGQMAAVKILPIELYLSSRMSLDTKEAKSEKHRMSIDKEIVMMKLMDHPNIVRIYDVFESDKELFLVLEYVDGGELFDYLVNHGKMEPMTALCYFKQIIYGLSYAHAFSIIHRDLKPENVLIHSLNPPRIKIADWGMAAFAAPGHQLATSCGSPHYASPEIVNGKKYNGTATDIWSCGVILYALLTGRLPFDHKDIKTLLGKVKTGKFEIPNYVHHEAADLIKKMIVVDVDQRIKMTDILTHPFLQHDTPGLTYVPAPSLEELARPIHSTGQISPELMRSLAVICAPIMGIKSLTSDEDYAELEDELLSLPGEGSLIKALYFLLLKHREKSLESSRRSNGRNGSIDNGIGDEWRIRHYAAPPVKSPVPQSPESSYHSSSSRKFHSGTKQQATRTIQASLPTPSHQQPLSPIVDVEETPTRAHSYGGTGVNSSRQRPVSPVGPRPPQAYSHNQHERVRPMSTPNPRRSTASAPLSSPQSSSATNSTANNSKNSSANFPAFARKPSSRPRTRTLIDGLPIVNAPPFSNASGANAHLNRNGGNNGADEEDGDYGFVTISMPSTITSRDNSNGAESNGNGVSTPPRSPRTILTNAPAGVRQTPPSQPQRQGSVQMSPPLRPVQPPQVNDPALQRTIDDIAVRFNVLVERTGDMNNGNGGTINQPQNTAQGGQGGQVTPVHVYTQALLQQGRSNTETKRGYNVQVDDVSEERDRTDKANKENRYEDGTAATTATPPSVKNRAGNAGKETKAAQRKSRPPPLEINNANIRRATLISSPPPAFHANSAGSGSSLVSPGFASPVLSPTSMVVEFKGWFSNLFNWKAHQYVLHSVDSYLVTRNEVMRMFESFGVGFVLEDERGYGVLRCRVDEVYDISTGTLAQKAVRFRVEFSPVLGYIHTTSPRASLDTPSFISNKSPHILSRADTDVEKTGELAPFASTLVMVQEKGALSTFRNVYNKLKAEWKLDALRSAEHTGVGSGIELMGAGLSTRISR